MVKSKIILAGFWAHTHCEESFSKQIIDNGIDVIPFKISKYFQGKWGKYITKDLEEYQCWNVTWLPEGYKNPKELKDMERYAFRKFYLRPSYILKRILKIRSLEDIKRYFKGGTALVKSFL